MCMCAPFAFVDTPGKTRFSKLFFVIGTLDLAGNVCFQTALQLAGSSLTTVIYSSVIVFTALGKLFLLKRKLSVWQWLGIFIIMGGLALAGIDAQSEGGSMLLGAFCGLGAAMFYGAMYTYVEKIYMQPDAPREELLCFFVGIYCTTLLGLYVAFFTGANWATLVTQEVVKDKGSYYGIMGVYLAVVVAYFLHYMTFYYCVSTSDSVSTGVNKAVQSVSVFGVSTIYCNVDSDLCFNGLKGASLAVVVFGVLVYAFATKHASTWQDSSSLPELEESPESTLQGKTRGRTRSPSLPLLQVTQLQFIH